MLRHCLLGPGVGSRLLLGVSLTVWFASAEAAEGGPSCAAHPGLSVVNSSIPLTEVQAEKAQALDVLTQFGVNTIIRYYDHDAETIACKTLLPEESDEILAKGFSIAVVFQHNNGDPETFFSKVRGEEDAKRSLALAAANGQPYGSAIYFGVDGADQVIADMVFEYRVSHGMPMTKERKDLLINQGKATHVRFYARFLHYKSTYFGGKPVSSLTPNDILPFVKNYFMEVNRVFQEAAKANPHSGSYDVGGYGSGLVCDFLLTNKLVKYCWLAQSDGWPGYAAFKTSNNWRLLQEKPTKCPSWSYLRDKRQKVDFDFNTPNASNTDFGQWSKKTPNPTPIVRPKSCPAQ